MVDCSSSRCDLEFVFQVFYRGVVGPLDFRAGFRQGADSSRGGVVAERDQDHAGGFGGLLQGDGLDQRPQVAAVFAPQADVADLLGFAVSQGSVEQPAQLGAHFGRGLVNQVAGGFAFGLIEESRRITLVVEDFEIAVHQDAGRRLVLEHRLLGDAGDAHAPPAARGGLAVASLPALVHLE